MISAPEAFKKHPPESVGYRLHGEAALRGSTATCTTRSHGAGLAVWRHRPAGAPGGDDGLMGQHHYRVRCLRGRQHDRATRRNGRQHPARGSAECPAGSTAPGRIGHGARGALGGIAAQWRRRSPTISVPYLPELVPEEVPAAPVAPAPPAPRMSSSSSFFMASSVTGLRSLSAAVLVEAPADALRVVPAGALADVPAGVVAVAPC